jgi:hypothetical protein
MTNDKTSYSNAEKLVNESSWNSIEFFNVSQSDAEFEMLPSGSYPGTILVDTKGLI